MSAKQHNGCRSIRESQKAETQLAEAIKSSPRIEQVWIGDSWRLMREPEGGVCIDGTHYIMKFPSFKRIVADVPGVSILYSFDDQYVDIVSIRFLDED